MILRSLLSRDPKWQSEDPGERAVAATRLAPDSPELLTLVSDDPDPAVRAAAAARVSDVEALRRRLERETESAAREAMVQRAAELLAGSAENAPPIDARLAAFDRPWPEPVVERTLLLATDAAIQQRAVAALPDDAALTRIADSRLRAEVRSAAIDRIRSADALAAVSRSLKGHDKTLWRRAQARLDGFRDSERRGQDAESLVAAIEAIADSAIVAGNQVAALERSWESLRYHGPLAERFATALGRVRSRLQDQMQVQQSGQRVLGALAELIARLPPDGSDPVLLRSLEEGLQAQKLEWETIAASTLPRTMQSQFTQRRIELEERLATLNSDVESLARREVLLERLGEHVEKGNATGARTLLAQWRQLPPPRPSAARATQDARYAQLRDLAAAAAGDGHGPGQGAGHATPGNAASRTAPGSHGGGAAQDRPAGAATPDHVSPAEPATPEPSPLVEAVDALEAAMNEGAFALARERHDRLADLLAKAPHPAATLARRIEAARLRFSELAGWQRWGSAQAHEQLCAEAEGLIASPLPAAELARSVQALRERWKALDHEQGTAPGGLWHRFDKACTRAYEPARRHFAEESKKRAERTAAREAFCADIAARSQALVDSAAPIKELQRELDGWRRKWRDLGPVERPKWKELDKRFDQAAAAAKGRIDEAIERSRTRRRQLVDEAKALAEQPVRSAVSAVKTLQQSWKDEAAAVMLPRGEEQRLWEAFRGACNAVFDRREAEVKSAASKHQGIVDAKTALLDELDRLLGDDGADRTTGLQKALADLDSRWRGAGHAGRDEERRLGERRARIEAAARARLATLRRSRHLAVFDVLAHRGQLAADAERAARSGEPAESVLTELRAQWAAAPKLPPELEAPIKARFEHAARGAGAASAADPSSVSAIPGDPSPAGSPADPPSADEALRHELALRAEILAGIDSPAADSRQRMALRVEYLGRSIGGDSPNALAEMQAIAARWHALSGDPAQALQARFDRALRAFQSKSAHRGGDAR